MRDIISKIVAAIVLWAVGSAALAQGPAGGGPGPQPVPSPWIVSGAQISYSSGCVMVPVTVNGGCKGNGSFNATSLYQNGFAVLSTDLASARILVGDSSGVATPVSPSGDLTMTNAGVFTVSANVVTNAKLAQAAAVTLKGNPTNATANVQDFTLAGLTALASPSTTLDILLIWDHTAGTLKSVTPSALSTAVGGITALTGDVTATGPGSVAATLVTAQPGAHTWAATQTFTLAPVFTDQSGSRAALGLGTAAVQNVGTSGANVPLLDGANTWGAVQTLPSPALTGTVTGNNTIPLAILQQSAANTILGNWTGLAANVVVNAMPSCPDTGGNHLNYVSGTGITCGTGLGAAVTSLTGDVVATGPGAAAATIQPNVVTYAKFQQVAASSLVGNATGVLANATGITLGSTLAFSGSALQTGAGTGDVSWSANSFSTTLATVNSNVGSFGSSTAIPVFTVNGKGLITAASTAAVVAPAGTLTGTTLNSTVVTSSLTSVGALGAGSSTTGFTIEASNVTWTGAVPAANLPVATAAARGIVQGDGSTLTITTGTISCTTATSSQIGCARPDNSTITISGGVITAIGGAATSVQIGVTTITSGTSSRVLYDNAGVLGEMTTSGSGTVLCLATSCSMTTPTLGVATATSINKMAITAPATGSTLAVADGKTATISNTLTFTGTDGSSAAFGTGGTVAYRIASGTKSLATGAISSATCTAAQTDTATGAATTDAVIATFSADVTGTTGYVPLTTGMLTIIAWPTANTVNFKVCNNTASSIAPGAVAINWRVLR